MNKKLVVYFSYTGNTKIIARWYTAPRIINTFLESYDFSNKKVILYCTSGGSSIDKTYNDLKNSYPNIDFIKGSRLYSNSDIDKFIKDVR